MKTILLTPPLEKKYKTPTFPFGITSIAAVLEEQGEDVKIFDYYLRGPEQFNKDVRRFDADVFGISCNVIDRYEALATSNRIKEEHPHSLIVLGGAFPTMCHREILESQNMVDVVVRGEGEYSLLELVKGKPLSEIKGISYKEKARIKINPPRPFIDNLDELPPPAFHLLELDKYPNFLMEEDLYLDENRASEIKTYTSNMLFGRGCPFNCVFCSSKNMWSRSYRIISPKNAFENVKYFLDKGIKGFSFYDDHLLLNKKWFSKFSELIGAEDDEINYKCLGRVDSINKEVAEKLRDSGCISVALGIENGSDGVLELMNKKINAETSERAVRLLFGCGISSRGGMLINTPGETFTDIKISLRFFKKLRDNYKLISGKIPTPLQIYPGSDLEVIAKNNHKIRNGFNWTEPYFNKRNLLLGSPTHVPIYENIKSEILYGFLAQELLRMGELRAVKTMIRFFYNYLNSNEPRLN